MTSSPFHRVRRRPTLVLTASVGLAGSLLAFTPLSTAAADPSIRSSVAHAAATPATTSPVPPKSTYLSYSSARGDHIGEGKSHTFIPSSSVTVRVSGTDQHLSVHATTGHTSWTLDLAPGAGDQLRPGVFTNAETYPTQTGRAPGLRVRADGRICQAYGSFTVNQIGFTTKGAITMADISVIQRCGSTTAPELKATIHLNQWPLSYKQASDPGDYVGRGLTHTYYNSTSVMTFSDLTPQSIEMHESGLNDNWDVLMQAPRGTSFTPGNTYTTRNEGGGDPSKAVLEASGDGRGCNNFTGTLTIKKITVSAVGTVTHLYATFTQLCDTDTGLLHGTIHYLA